MKASYLNMRIHKELSKGLTEYLQIKKLDGVKTSKTHIVERFLFKLLSKEGLLSKNFIKEQGKRYE
jgi:hypothetical protein